MEKLKSGSEDVKTSISKVQKRNCYAKRKVLTSPNVKDSKQKTMSSYITRLKRKRSLDRQDADVSNTSDSLFSPQLGSNDRIHQENTQDSSVSPFSSKDHFKSNSKMMQFVDDTDSILCNMKTLSFTADNETLDEFHDSISNGENHFETNSKIDLSIDEAKPIESYDNSLTWISNLDWDEKESIDDDLVKDEGDSNMKDVKYKVCGIKKHHSNSEVELLLSASSDSSICKCLLRGFWTDTLISEGDEVRVLAPFVNGSAVIDDQHGFLVVHPDFLISSTSVVSTLFCMRKATLSHKFRSWDSTNKIMMIGNLVHQVFQKAISDHYCSEYNIEDVLNKVLKRTGNIISMYCQGVSEMDMRTEFSAFVSSISEWIKKHCSSSNLDHIQILDVCDIEDNIWCPRYGIKGKIDLTVKVKDGKEQGKLMPLELKTGASSFSAEHQGQVNLYTLMMEDRTGQNSDGLLLYLRNRAEMKVIPSEHKARRGLIQLRNELSHYTYKMSHEKESFEEESCGNMLPDPLNSKRFCGKCSYLLPCTLYQRLQKKKIDASHAMTNLVPEATKHLAEMDLTFFQRWSHLQSLEHNTIETKSFWDEDTFSREKDGLCMSNMVLKDEFSTQQIREGSSYVHRFFRSDDSPVKSSLSSVGLMPGDYIAISNQNNKLEVALATGFIVHVQEDFVEVSVERDIQKLERYQHYVFRLDKQISGSVGGASGYNNLIKLMMNNDQSSRLRRLLVEKEAPAFQATMSKSVAFLARPFMKSLNHPQRKAIFKALMADDYMLLKGMPGTGKTATIVALVRLLVAMKYSVLLTSHTHSAVDNILLKLMENKMDFLRLGQLPKIHPAVQSYSFELAIKDIKDVSELQEFLKSKKVVATTCLGVNNVILQSRQFDYCIVDESSQITLPDCLGPLFLSKKFILVGDPKQLPPVIINKQASKQGLQESLLTHLETSQNCMELTLQYRMNREIMRICNHLAYNNSMKCGSKDIETSTLQLENESSRTPSHWLSLAVDCKLENSVLFLDTDEVPAAETRDDFGRVKNDIEKELVCLLANEFIQIGLPSSSIGVISPYRCQVQLIRKCFHGDRFKDIEVNTVDQYQGRDKDVIMISCVRSKWDLNDSNTLTSTIMDDIRRLNVAVSRAKKKLLIIGSRKTLLNYSCFADMLSILRIDQFLTLSQNATESI